MFIAIRAAIIVFWAVGIAAAQSQPVNVSVSQGKFDAAITATRTEPYLAGDPYAGIPVSALGDETKIVAQARVRAWSEGTRFRVVVFAVQNPMPGKYLETPIATFVATPGESERTVAMDDFGGTPIKVRVAYK